MAIDTRLFRDEGSLAGDAARKVVLVPEPRMERLKAAGLSRTELLNMVQRVGADGAPLLTTTEFWSLYPDATA